ncbi:hypothetical protein H5085_10195 [Pseudoalteromonas sp. SR43-6]|uniref:hypothetical protein n=1 Tax=unclassified Pseudoalteromonas TaxID=194690 RepID=UPI0015FA3115|nr:MULTISPECIES: hypothetical protein [unclassified Pseudoalteromonas]MBB1288898.1 hypothetical protein [Pseudoalteromonas sp. SR41-5]MBB1374689.1 hypothetical protein [Pseudoalteromonas sp. SR43-6]MBB1413803.1 hypothetical protein [Pseudoalteromonas sp. SG43-8]
MKKLIPIFAILLAAGCANVTPSSQYVSESGANSNKECKTIPRHKHTVQWCKPHSSR